MKGLRLFAACATMVAAIAVGIGGVAAAQSGELQGGGLTQGGASSGAGAATINLGMPGGPSSMGAPHAIADERVFDFGTVIGGKPVTHVFKIRNDGSAPLVIGAVITSCGCTAAKPTKSTIGPGETSEIATSLDTTSEHGPTTRTITVATNDPKAQSIVLTLKGDIRQPVDAEPAEVAFGVVKHGTEAVRQVTIIPLVHDPNFKVESASNENRDIKVALAPRPQGEQGAILTVTLLKTMPAGGFADMVKVTTSREPINVSVFGEVQGDLALKPVQVSFGVVEHRQPAQQYARLVNTGPRPIKVISVASTNRNVAATVQPITPGREYKITLQLQPNSPDGALRGMLAIKTDDPNQPTINLPFYGIIGSFKG
jgi:hypothetical protein